MYELLISVNNDIDENSSEGITRQLHLSHASVEVRSLVRKALSDAAQIKTETDVTAVVVIIITAVKLIIMQQ